MRSLTFVIAGLALGCLTANVRAQDATAPIGAGPARAERAVVQPYLSNLLPDTSAIIGPPPAPGSAAQAADLAAYWNARASQGSPRWTLATSDVVTGTAVLLADFSCALGRRLDPTTVPRLVSLLERARVDAGRATRRGKDAYRRVRPHVGNTGPICVDREPRLDTDFAYPSGHATLGWTVALILASLAPEHATAILTRGRVYGESRIVCGVHWRSDVEAGRTTAASLVATLGADAAFRADLDAARAELSEALATAAPDAETCRIEADAAATGIR